MIYVPYIAYFLLLLAIVVFGGFGAWLRIRRLRNRAVVQTLASIVGQNLPLPASLRAAARGEWPGLRKTYERLALRLDVGDDLATALRVSMLACPGHILGAVQAAQRGGTLPSVLQSLASDARREQDEPTTRRMPWWYPFLLLVIVAGMLVFARVAVLPKYREIFADFGAELPPLTLTLLGAGPSGSTLLPLLAALAGVAALVVLQVAIGRHFLPRVPEHLQALYMLWDTAIWYLPVTRAVARNRALARQLPILHAAIQAGHDLGEGARQAACVDANFHARRRLTRWAAALDMGADPLQSARELGFPAPFIQALTVSRNGGDLALRLAYLAAYYQALRTHWEQMLTSALAPVLVLLWAICVGYIVVAMFLPLVSLINATLASIY
jgi:type IV pilus assembly protein PilC